MNIMETDIGIQCIQMYTASMRKYTVYNMYTGLKEKGVII